MKLLTVVAGISGFARAIDFNAPLFENGADASRIPTSYESAVMGRRILALTKLGTLSTVFPGSSSGGARNGHDHQAGAQENRPDGLSGVPIGLMDYIADCEDEGNPTILAIKIATSFKNAREGSNVTLSLQWTPPYPPTRRISLFSRLSEYIPYMGGALSYNNNNNNIKKKALGGHSSSEPDTVPYSAANLPRFSLIGYLEPIKPNIVDAVQLAECYLIKHHDAKYWLPGNPIHTSEWMRLVVTQVYWIGGFGDRAYIGWIPVEDWKKVTKEEWQGIQLPGEKKGWSEWSIGEAGEL